MFYQAFQPDPALRSYVSGLYFFMGDVGDPGSTHTFRFPSDGGPELILNLGDPFAAGCSDSRLRTFTGASIIGPLSCNLLTHASGLTAFVAVRFRPGGMGPFFDLPAEELTDWSTELDTLWGTFGRQMQQQVADARTPASAADAVQSALKAKRRQAYRADRGMHQAIDTITASHGLVRVGHLARSAGLSRRQFERRFRRMAGLSPKRLCRIVRFANLCRCMAAGVRPDWAQTALACGYSDQAHMIRECRFFTGHSPQAYLRHRSPLEAAIYDDPAPMSHLFNTTTPASAIVPHDHSR